MAAPAAPLTVEQVITDEFSRDPQKMMRRLDGLDAEDSLSDFGALMWPILEPGRKLVRDYAWDAICEHLTAVHTGDIRHLLINVPPGFSKSLLLDVFFPAWEWGPCNRPDLRNISFSYNIDITIRDNLRCRRIIQSDLYQELWGDRFFIVSDQNAKTRFDTNMAGFKLASSLGSVGMGERADRLALDDPNNVKTVEHEAIRLAASKFFAEVLPTRTTEAMKTAFIVIQQRTHSQDVSGVILGSGLPYEWLCLPMEYTRGRRCFTTVPTCFKSGPNAGKKKPLQKVKLVHIEGEDLPSWYDHDTDVPHNAERVGPVRELVSQDWRTEDRELLAPKRFPREHIENELKPALRLIGGTYAESGQLDQKPSHRDGGMFQRKDFTILELNEWPKGGAYARAYDLAGSTRKTSPWSVGLKIAVIDDAVYISDVSRERKLPGAVILWMQALAKQDGYGVEIDFPQDPAQAGKWQVKFIAGKLGGYTVRSSPESGKKEDRPLPLAAQAENGNLYLLRGLWNDTFINEACNFPTGTYKDQMDAAARGYARALKLATRTGSVPVAPKIIEG